MTRVWDLIVEGTMSAIAALASDALSEMETGMFVADERVAQHTAIVETCTALRELGLERTWVRRLFFCFFQKNNVSEFLRMKSTHSVGQFGSAREKLSETSFPSRFVAGL